MKQNRDDGCLNHTTLEAYVLGDASDDDNAELERHVDTCAACRRLLADLTRALLKSAGARADAPPPTHSTGDEARQAPFPARLRPGDSAGPLRPGQRFGRYEIEALLGQGGMGHVYRARDTRLARQVAIKALSLTGKGAEGGKGAEATARIARLLREARAAAAIDHPSAVAIYDVDEIDDVPFIAMELVSGHPLRKLISRADIGRTTRVRWLIEIAGALGAAHARGIVHRDVKPDNVMITRDGRAIVLDFGIARRAAGAPDLDMPTLTEKGMTPGTPRYMAPEQLRAQPLDGRTDQFSWGVLAYEMLARKWPWAGDALAVGYQITTVAPPPIDDAQLDVPAGLAAIVLRAMAKAPEDRFNAMTEVAAALEPFAAPPGALPDWKHGDAPQRSSPEMVTLDGQHESESASTPAVASALVDNGRAPESRGKRRRRGTTALAAALVTLAGLGAALLVYRSRPAEVVPAGPLRIAALDCSDAALTGDGASPELSRAIGAAACARLAIEVGVAWRSDPAAPKLDVSAALASDHAEATLSVADRSARAVARTPLDAIEAAVAELGKQLRPTPLTPGQIEVWGAKDEAGARQIERLAYRAFLGMDITGDVKRLRETVPESPWPLYYGFVNVLPRGSSEEEEARKQILGHSGALPPAWANAMRGLLYCEGSPTERSEALRLLQKEYTRNADDIWMAAHYMRCLLANASPDIAFAVVDRLWERHGARSAVAIATALRTESLWEYWDLEWNQKQLDRIHAVLPESIAWEGSVAQLVARGRFEQARAAVRFAQQLGVGGASTDEAYKQLSVKLEIDALEPGKARAMASQLLGDPRPLVVAGTMHLLYATYMLEGRVAEAGAILARESQRFRQLGNMPVAQALAANALPWKRHLDRPPPPPRELDEMALACKFSLPRADCIRVHVEVGLAKARSGAAGKAAARSILAAIEESDEQEHRGEHAERDSPLVVTLPLVRELRGDREAVALWRRFDRAAFPARNLAAFDAALALEAVGDEAGAEEAYLLAQRPWQMSAVGFQAVAARLRLAVLYRKRGRVSEAAALEAVVDQLWAKADPGVREAVLRLR